MENLDLISILGSTIRLSIPLIFTALAGLFTERAGVFDIGLEGKMLFSAFAAAVGAFMTGSPWIGLLAGITVSVLISLMTCLLSGCRQAARRPGCALHRPCQRAMTR